MIYQRLQKTNDKLINVKNHIHERNETIPEKFIHRIKKKFIRKKKTAELKVNNNMIYNNIENQNNFHSIIEQSTERAEMNLGVKDT